jgi:hypothetical protein
MLSDIQCLLHPFTLTSGEIHCHGLDSLALQFYPGRPYCSIIKTWPPV